MRSKADIELDEMCKTLSRKLKPLDPSVANSTETRRTPAQSRLVLTLLNQAEALSLSNPRRSHELLVQAILMFAETHVIAN